MTNGQVQKYSFPIKTLQKEAVRMLQVKYKIQQQQKQNNKKAGDPVWLRKLLIQPK